MNKASVTGYVQKPKYIESELKKTINVNVTELIKSAPADKPLTVLKSIHDALQDRFDEVTNELSIRTEERDTALGVIEALRSEIEILNQTVDSEKILRTVADNQLGESNDRYQLLLGDFQVSVQKGIQEAVERVSLEAQVSGLNAQLLSVRDQLFGAQAETTAAASGLSPDENGNMFYKFVSNENASEFIWTTSRDNKTDNQFGSIEVQNLRDVDIPIVKLEFKFTEDPASDIKDNDNKTILHLGPIGFTNTKKPSSTKTINIMQGPKQSIEVFGGSTIGGKGDGRGPNNGTMEPDGKGLRNTDKTYFGTIQLIATYEDGLTGTSEAVNWKIQKNKK